MLQKTLEQRSNNLYKEAHPFALRTLKDWMEALRGSLGSGGGNGVGDSSARPHGNGKSSSAEPHHQHQHKHQRQRHPWELDAEDLVLGDVIGTGGYGRVFRAEYKGGAVAVKTLFTLGGGLGGADDDDLLADTASEAQVLSQLRHVNTLRFFGVSFLRREGCVAMVTELCQQDLRAWIDQPGA